MQDWWYGMKAAAKYVAARAAGDKATEAEALSRARVCAVCPSKAGYSFLGRAVAFCGPPVEDRLGADPPTCGCLVLAETERATGLTVGGVVVGPAGKAVVGSERCPQGKWGTVERRA